MKQRKATRKTGATKRTAKAVATRRKAVRSLALPVECGIAVAQLLKSNLLKRLSETGNVRIDASAVQRIDTAGLQVLAAFARDRRASGLTVDWVGVPATLADAASLLNLSDTLGLAQQANAVRA